MHKKVTGSIELTIQDNGIGLPAGFNWRQTESLWHEPDAGVMQHNWMDNSTYYNKTGLLLKITFEPAKVIEPMNKKILIVEDEFIVANDLRLILKKAGFQVCAIADTFNSCSGAIHKHSPELVLLDIYLKGNRTGIDLARVLTEKISPLCICLPIITKPFSRKPKATQPYGFLVKPFREKDVLVALEIAHYRHAHSMEAKMRKEQTLQIELTNIMTH